MSYSVDYRRRALALLASGKKKSHIAQLLGIARTTLDRWLARPSIEPDKMGPKGPSKLSAKALQAHVEAYPDAYQYERAEALGVSRHVVLYGLKRLGIKKNAAVQGKRRQSSQIVS
jgi:transposase